MPHFQTRLSNATVLTVTSLILLGITFPLSARSENELDQSSLALPEDKTYLLFAFKKGNLNNQLNIIMNTLYAVYKSPHRDQLRIVIPRFKTGASVLDETFVNTLNFDYLDLPDFLKASNVNSIMDGITFYGMDEQSATETATLRFDEGFFEEWNVQNAFIFPRARDCGFLSWVDRAYEHCAGWDKEQKQTTKPCKSFIIPCMFTNLINCSSPPQQTTDWTAFRGKFFVPADGYNQVVQGHYDVMERPVLALHLRFLPYGFGEGLYRKPYGQWREGDLPARFSVPLFIKRTEELYQCLEKNHGWEKPKSLYLLGWPKLVNTLRKPLESLGYKTYTRGFDNNLNPVLVDELIALEADYLHSSFRSTLTLNIAEVRVTRVGKAGNQYLPDCLPNYGKAYNPDMADSPCAKYVVEPQHDENSDV